VQLRTDHGGLTGTRKLHDYRRETAVTRLHPCGWRIDSDCPAGGTKVQRQLFGWLGADDILSSTRPGTQALP
jgi:hypothetical protein